MFFFFFQNMFDLINNKQLLELIYTIAYVFHYTIVNVIFLKYFYFLGKFYNNIWQVESIISILNLGIVNSKLYIAMICSYIFLTRYNFFILIWC